MKISILISALLSISFSAVCQAQSVNELLDLEAKVAASKLKDELNKSGKSAADPTALKLPDAPAPAPVVKRKVEKIQPVTIAVYGISPEYKAKLNFGSAVVTVANGSVIDNKVVTRIVAEGVYMKPVASNAASKKSNRHKKTESPSEQFFPLMAM